MKYILLSGSLKGLFIPIDVVNFIRKNLERFNISFIPCDFMDYKGNDKFSNKIIDLFKEQGLYFENIFLIDNRLKLKNMKERIYESNIIFLLGGDTLKQNKYLNKYKLKNLIKSTEIVIGISAGSINMAKKVVLPRDISDNIPKMMIYKGIGVTDLNIEPHCNFNDKEHFYDLIDASYINEIIVMNDNSYIISDNFELKFYGNYFILKNGNIYYKNKKTSLSIFLNDINYNEYIEN